jgi:L-ascorbate metabolism protein UlaG (beta-lactamase superfamily)
MADIRESQRPPYGDSITWFGHACFRVTDAEGHTVLIDPYAEEILGQALDGLRADVAIITHEHPDHNNINAVQARHLIHAGELVRDGEARRVGDAMTGFIFTLIPTFHDEAHGQEYGENAAVVWQEGGITFCHLGDLGHLLTSEEVALIGRPDVLMLPVGGAFTIDGQEARRVVAQLRPHVVIPMHYRIPGMTEQDLPLATAEPFLVGDGAPTPWQDIKRLNTPVLLVDADHLPSGTEVDVLTPPHLH